LIFGEKYHRYFYLLGLFMMAAGLPLSKFLIGTGIFTVAINWGLESRYIPKVSYYFPRPQWPVLRKMFIEGNWAPKWRLFLQRRSILVLILFFILHLVGIIWAKDAGEAWKDVRIKLPLFLLPLVIGTSKPLDKKFFEALLMVFTLAVFISSLSTILVANGIVHPQKPITDFREASRFVPLIRLSLMVVLSVFLTGRWMIRVKNFMLKLLCLLLILWFAWFLAYMQSLTGLVIIFAGGFFLLVVMAFIYRRKKLVVLLVGAFLLACAGGGYMLRKAYKDFYDFKPVDAQHLDAFSPHGHPYHHELNYPMMENGNQVMIYVCWNELDSAWNSRSKIELNGGKDVNGNPIAITLVRYLASKGVRKDADAIAAMTDAEIRGVENGMTNALDSQRTPIERRLYQVFWEIYHYQHGGNPSGNSVTMRMELAHTAVQCIRQQPWIGNGTGGQKAAFAYTYDTNGTQLGEEWRTLHSHNQFLAIAVTLGIPATLFFIFMLWYAPASMRRWKSYLYLAFFITFFLSCFDDDTLETMQGVFFFGLFNSLFLYAMPRASAVVDENPGDPEEQE
jgi:hypothetical protein